jgi:hypothetical protein
MNRPLTFLAAISITSGIVSTDSYANDGLEELKVTGRNINLVGSAVSASEGYVDQSEISLRPLGRTGELMELVPGMVATQHSGSGKANQYFLRGFNLDHGTDFATYVDGMPVNMRTHGHGQGYTDINFVIPELVDSLAYKKGPYYVQVGDFSGAGSAHFSTANRLNEGEVELAVGEDNYQRILIADSQPALGGELLYAVELQETDGPWEDISEDVDKTSVLIKHTSRINDGDFSVTLMGYDNVWNGADQIPQRAVDAGTLDEFGTIDITVGGESSRYSLSLSYNSDVISYSAYVIDYDLDLFSNFSYFIDQDNGDQFEQVDERMVWGGQGHRHFDSGKMRNTFGGDFRYDDIEEVGLYKSTGGIRRGAVRTDEVEEWSLGLYWMNNMEWTDKLRTTVGVRYDYFDFDVNGLIDTNIDGIDLTANGGSADDDIVTVKGGFNYTFNDHYEGYFSIGQGYHSNDARGTTTVVNPEDGAAIDTVDPLVDSFGYEVGLRAFFNEQLNASIALWALELDSELLFVGDAGNTEATRSTERSGVEITAYYRIDDVWTLDLEYAYSDAEFDEPDASDPTLGDKIPGAVDDVVQLGISANYKNGYYGSLRARYFGEAPLEENGDITGESSTIVNLLAGKDWDEFGVKLEVLNLLDSDDRDIEYYYESQLTTETAPVEDIHFRIFEPRTFRISAHVKF